MHRNKKGGIYTNGRVRRTKKGFAKEKTTIVWKDHGDGLGEWTGDGLFFAQHYCDRCGHRFCGTGEGSTQREKVKRKRFVNNEITYFIFE